MVLYTCKYCDYTTSIKTHYIRHQSTKKHLRNTSHKDDKSEKSIKKVYFYNNEDHNENDYKNVNNTLNDNDIGDFKTFLKFAPPLRSENDRKSLRTILNTLSIEVNINQKIKSALLLIFDKLKKFETKDNNNVTNIFRMPIL